MTRNELKIVSGAQTGVDQGGLLAAIDLGLEWGGWVPKGWRTENGTGDARVRPKMRGGVETKNERAGPAGGPHIFLILSLQTQSSSWHNTSL